MKTNSSQWFTLIELVIAITVLSIIMTSVFVSFMLAADLNNKTDISRALQENIKNIVETLGEDVRKNGITWVNDDIVTGDCDIWTGGFSSGSKLCIWWNSYYLATKADEGWSRVNDSSECDDVTQCFLVRNNWSSVLPLSNSWVDFKDLSFFVFDWGEKRVLVHFIVQPSKTKWVKPGMIQDNKLIFQTTLSQRLYNDY